MCLLALVGTRLYAGGGVWADSLCELNVPNSKCTGYKKEDNVTIDYQCDGKMDSTWSPGGGLGETFPTAPGKL